MTSILAALDTSPAAGAVLATAREVAGLLHLPCRAIHVTETPAGTPDLGHVDHHDIALDIVAGDTVAALVDAVAQPDVTLVVLGSRSRPAGALPAGHIATAIVERADKPVVVVPPALDGGPRPIRRALVPLEGTAETSAAITSALRLLTDAGVELVVLHVFETETVPRFWDSPAHARASYASEFLARWCDEPSVAELRLRRGSPPATIVEVAELEDVDLIALGWAQTLRPGRARIVRAALAQNRVPVLLVPCGPAPDPDPLTSR